MSELTANLDLGTLKWDLGICTGQLAARVVSVSNLGNFSSKCGKVENVSGFCDFVVIAIKGHGTSLLNPLAHSTVPENNRLTFRTNFYFMNVTMFWWKAGFLEFQQ